MLVLLYLPHLKQTRTGTLTGIDSDKQTGKKYNVSFVIVSVLTFSVEGTSRSSQLVSTMAIWRMYQTQCSLGNGGAMPTGPGILAHRGNNALLTR